MLTHDTESNARHQGAAVGVVAGGRGHWDAGEFSVPWSQLSQNKKYTMSLVDCPPLSFPEAQISWELSQMDSHALKIDPIKFHI